MLFCRMSTCLILPWLPSTRHGIACRCHLRPASVWGCQASVKLPVKPRVCPWALAPWGLPKADLIASNLRTEGAIQMDIGQSDCCWLVGKDFERVSLWLRRRAVQLSGLTDDDGQ